ncbi:T9SS type A sorting domain-containing protein [Neolewinella aurantiaca]|uniref:T9SS type A sorting domain-containing protein n=1 Tax=Neolewinella aurantiaca TaxID=2602767 RepID=A0A5C7FCL0_9BACT|nr:T9SS type A sorting domain-containing protein [Neolewinella aurantiaca]TXF82105.1 T9SS type A sorting domain-containing protein [Neolewinella aurantiaca]
MVSFTEEETDELELNERFTQKEQNLNIDIDSDNNDRTSLFPNPVSVGQPITLKVNKNLLKKKGYTPIIISDINGRVVLNSRIQNIVTTLNLDDVVSKGYYIIQVVGDNEVNKIPFIVR